jgi:hypothetical protein
MADSVIVLTCSPTPALISQFINHFRLNCRIHVETHQTSVSSVHIVSWKEMSTFKVLEISIKLAVIKLLSTIMPATDNCTQERELLSFNN